MKCTATVPPELLGTHQDAQIPCKRYRHTGGRHYAERYKRGVGKTMWEWQG